MDALTAANGYGPAYSPGIGTVATQAAGADAATGSIGSGAQANSSSQAVLSVVNREMLQGSPYIDAVTIELIMPAPRADNRILDVRA